MFLLNFAQWNLVCDQNPAAAEAAQSVLQIGGMFGGLFIGTLADRYGRRPSVLGGVILYCVSGIGICFSPNYATFMVLRFISGVSEMVRILFCFVFARSLLNQFRHWADYCVLWLFILKIPLHSAYRGWLYRRERKRKKAFRRRKPLY